MDEEDDDEYEDEVVDLQQKNDTPDGAVDKIPSGLGRICNLSMIMEQSYNDLEFPICGGSGKYTVTLIVFQLELDY